MKFLRRFARELNEELDELVDFFSKEKKQEEQKLRMPLLHVRINGKVKTVFDIENKKAA